MKQHITEKQWRELNNEQQLIIANRFNDGIEKPDFYVDNKNVYIPLSIGQMIEFLEERTHVSIGEWYRQERMGRICDSLWEAVKIILNG